MSAARAAGILHLLKNSPNRVAELRRFERSIDDELISQMLLLSFAGEKDHLVAEAVNWADLALKASLLGGTSLGRAEALYWRADVFLFQIEQGDGEEATLLQAAEKSLRAALDIYVKSPPAISCQLAYGLLARVLERRGDLPSAFASQLASTRVAIALGQSDDTVKAVRRLKRQYLEWPEDVRAAVAPMLLRDCVPLVGDSVDGMVAATLLMMIGDAHGVLGADEAAFAAWSRAAELCREADDGDQEFTTRELMFDHAACLDDAELACRLGEACVAVVTRTIPKRRLAEQYHLLSAIYSSLDRVDEAVGAYRKVIALDEADDRKSESGPLFLELAMLEVEHGRNEDAAGDLEQVLALPGGGSHYWLACVTLAEIRYRHFGDLGVAAESADRALELTISLSMPMAARAYSLYISGTLHLMAGAAEKAYRRFSALLQILRELPEPAMIHVSELFAHPITVPQLLISVRLMCQACLATGRLEEARAHELRYQELAGEVMEMRLPQDVVDEFSDEQVAELESLYQAVNTFMRGCSLRDTESEEALRHFAEAGRRLADVGDPQGLRAHCKALSGACLAGLGRLDEAAAAYRGALDAVDSSGHASDRYAWHLALARIALVRGQWGEAHLQLMNSVSLNEQYRASIAGPEERIIYLEATLTTYELLIGVLLHLGQPDKALTVLQQVKSRVLLDMLAEPTRRPIDAALDRKQRKLQESSEGWLAEFVPETLPSNVGPDYFESATYRMLSRAVDLGKERKLVDEKRKRSEVFERLSRHEPPLDFAAIRDLLRSSVERRL